VRAKPISITGAGGQYGGGGVTGEASSKLRDALATVGLSLEGAAIALECSPSRVQAKTDPRRSDVPVTYADMMRLARAGGKAREVARILHEDLGSDLEENGPLPLADGLPMLALQWSVQAGQVAQALAGFCAGANEQSRVAALRSIGSANKVLGIVRSMLARQWA
jgi:hypothetical protein